jgi:predicted secreted protein
MRLLPTIAAIVMLQLAGGAALADDDDRAFTRVQFDAQAMQEVDNDSMRATLFVETESSSPSGASSRATRTTNEALRRLQEDSNLRVRTGSFRTFPVSDKGKITGWRARSEILLESTDFERASAAIASASKEMQLSRVEFFVSPEMRETVESVLSDEAIAAFLAKARSIAKSFGATEFEVAEASVINQGGNAPPRPMMAAMSSDAPGRAPEFSGGTTRMSVTVSGVILIAR